MDKYDYITATVEEEKVRLEKIISYLKETDSQELFEYHERYNNILIYLNAKSKYINIENAIKNELNKLSMLNKEKDEYEVDNILLEDTLLSKFHEDTNGKYRNILYEDIAGVEESIRDVLYLIFEKQSNYVELTLKRDRLISKINRDILSKTYETLINQKALIDKQSNIIDEIFILENGIKVQKEKIRKLEDSVMTDSILKILYEFWIIDSYDKTKINRSKLFKDNRTLVSIKNNIEEVGETPIKPVIEEKKEEKQEDVLIPNLNLPGVDEDTQIDIDGKKYVKNDK